VIKISLIGPNSASTKSYEELHSRDDEVLGDTEVWNILDRGLFTVSSVIKIAIGN